MPRSRLAAEVAGSARGDVGCQLVPAAAVRLNEGHFAATETARVGHKEHVTGLHVQRHADGVVACHPEPFNGRRL